jgi:hypothetical protein
MGCQVRFSKALDVPAAKSYNDAIMRIRRLLRLLIWAAFVSYKSLAAADEVIVPSIPAGKTVAEAKATLSAAGLAAGFNAKGGKPDSKDLEFKTTGAQEPPGGNKVPRNKTVTVSIYQKYEPKTSAPSPSAPAALGNMPDLTGLTLEQAVARLPAKTEILSDELGGTDPPTPEKALTIFSQTPAAGTTFDPNHPPVVKVKRYDSAKTYEASSDPLAGKWFGVSIYKGDVPVEMLIRKEGSQYIIYLLANNFGYPLQSDGVRLWHTFGIYDITYQLDGDTLVGKWRYTDNKGGEHTGQTTFRRK